MPTLHGFIAATFGEVLLCRADEMLWRNSGGGWCQKNLV